MWVCVGGGVGGDCRNVVYVASIRGGTCHAGKDMCGGMGKDMCGGMGMGMG